MKPMVVLALLAGIAGWPPSQGAAADATYFGVAKTVQFQQTLGSAPAPLASDAYSFRAFVVAATNYAVTSATFTAPYPSSSRALTLNTNGDSLQHIETFQIQAALDAAYPSSTSLFFPSVYGLSLNGVHDGVRSANASYFLGGTPPTPQVANLAEGVGVDTTTSFTVRWTALGAGLVPVVQLLVADEGGKVLYSSPGPLTTNALTGSSTSGTIPPNTLTPGANLVGHLVFALLGLPDTNSYAGVPCVAAIVRDTAFPLTTRPAPAPPLLRLVSGKLRPAVLQFSGETNRNYHLQAATNPSPALWVDLLLTNASAASFTDTQSVSLPRRYYRVQVGP